MSEPETFLAMRRTDGELLYGEYLWATVQSVDEWPGLEEDEHDEPTEYEVVRMTVEPIAKRVFGDPLRLHEHIGNDCVYCDEQWPCEYVAELTATDPAHD